MSQNENIIPEKVARAFPHRTILIVLISLVTLLAAGVVSASVLNAKYSDKVLPGVHIGEMPIGGMQKTELVQLLESMNDKLTSEGFRFTLKGENGEKKFSVSPVVVSEVTSHELMKIDAQKEAVALINYGKKGNSVSRIVAFAKSYFNNPQVQLKHIEMDEAGIIAELEEQTKEYSQEPKNADIVVESRNPVQIKTTPAVAGSVFVLDSVPDKLQNSWAVLKAPELTLAAQVQEPRIRESDVTLFTSQVEKLFSAGPLILEYRGEGEPKVWNVSEDTFQKWIGLQQKETGEVVVGLKEEPTLKYIEDSFAPDINVEAQDARFTIGANGKVQEFQGSRVGIKVNSEKTLELLNQEVAQRAVAGTTSTLALVVETVEPEIKTGEVNDLGIKTVLGVGVSNFKGSPSNRIHNIRAALNKLNGVLLKPGEVFSAIQYTQPYTIEGGYLPEKVIKGDRIIPEIGGGLCQVGTTLFRMAMNSGLEIVERRNHSLVVSYYNDLQNGMPGTDATIYDPAPDFKFKNDTEGYVLIQASMNAQTGDLRFTLWGTSDGRKGYYTKPVVHNWISPGPARTVVSPTFKPGQKECQTAYRGANTSFSYIREMPDGTTQKRVFESHYRALPQICLVGPDAVPAPTPVDPTQPPSSQPTPASEAPVPVTQPTVPASDASVVAPVVSQ